MLDWLRHEAAARLAGIHACTLASAGPAGVQASWVACLAQELRLYLLLPAVADHLVNIEATSEVALAGDGWRLTGGGICLGEDAGPWMSTRQPWQMVVEVIPIRLYLDGENGQPGKSIDFAPLHP
jgi:hypothetical protein